ncbi:unnamed protein product [Sphagnum tenellum]
MTASKENCDVAHISDEMVGKFSGGRSTEKEPFPCDGNPPFSKIQLNCKGCNPFLDRRRTQKNQNKPVASATNASRKDHTEKQGKAETEGENAERRRASGLPGRSLARSSLQDPIHKTGRAKPFRKRRIQAFRSGNSLREPTLLFSLARLEKGSLGPEEDEKTDPRKTLTATKSQESVRWTGFRTPQPAVIETLELTEAFRRLQYRRTPVGQKRSRRTSQGREQTQTRCPYRCSGGKSP